MTSPHLETTSLHRALAGASRVRIMELLRAGQSLDAHELGKGVGLHPNTVRSHLDLLIEAGLVEGLPAPSTGPGRPRVVYRLMEGRTFPAGDEPGYKLLAQILASYLTGTARDPSAAAEEAGNAWGHYLTEKAEPFARLTAAQATQRIQALFQELGFAPEVRAEGDRQRILLHRCPFRETAETTPEVVCAVHLGLLRGALDEIGAPLEATLLEPFVEPSLCVAHMQLAG